jgi:hypothetical protein
MVRGGSPWEKRRLTHWTTQRSGTCPCLLGFQIWWKKLHYFWPAHLSVQLLSLSSTLLRFKDAPYKSHRYMYTMILPLEFAALSSVLSGKFVLFEIRRHAYIVYVVEDRDQQHVSLAEPLTFYSAIVHVRRPDGATILVTLTPIMVTSLRQGDVQNARRCVPRSYHQSFGLTVVQSSSRYPSIDRQ